MKNIKYTDSKGNLIAEGVMGDTAQEMEGNYYIDRNKVDFSKLSKKEKAYHCPIKNSDADYYYLSDENGEQASEEACWIYENMINPTFKNIEGKVGFYARTTNQLSLEESE